ncbi:MAG: ATP-binding protein [Desulfovibrio sp.]
MVRQEEWLVERTLGFAKKYGYAKYTSTLTAAWRVSIAGLSRTIVEVHQRCGNAFPGMSPDDDYASDPMTRFGVVEARLHRERGISLSMFLGLYKGYRYAFQEVARMLDLPAADQAYCHAFVERCFDRIEIAICSHWTALGEDRALEELQRANRQMTNEKNKYLTLFESLDSPVFLLDEHGVLDNANVAAARLLGLEHREGGMYYVLDGDESPPRHRLSALLPWLREPLNRLRQDSCSAFRCELEGLGAQKGQYFAATFSKMRDVSGKFHGGIVLLDDVTEQKVMERLKDDVEHMARHDLKVPLSNVISVFNYLLDEGGLTPEQREMLTLGRESGYTMLGMINNSLDILKMEMGIYRFEPRAVDLEKVLARVVENADSAARRQGVSVSTEVRSAGCREGSGGLRVLAEEMLLHSVLGNLLANALEASPRGGGVRIIVLPGENCRIIIRNQGGVPEQVREHFFQKFATWGKKNGTGLGTYSARLIIETMGGSIAMESDGDSTELALELPTAEAEA